MARNRRIIDVNDYERVTFLIDKKMKYELNILCAKMGMTKTEFISRAIRKELDNGKE
jgi:hypothetical protein